MIIQTGITTFGLIFLPIVILWIVLWSKHLIPLLVFSSIFQAASIYNLGSFAIAPYYFVSIVVAVKLLFSLTVLKEKIFFANKNLKFALIALFSFGAWGLVSAITMPLIFEGLPVFNPRGGIDEQYYFQARLVWGMSNVAQVVYLLLNIINVIAVIQYISNETNKNISLKSFLYTAYIALFFVLYHSLSKFIDISYPNDLLFSNPFYAQGFAQVVGNLFRANGTFTEPSLAGAYIAGIAIAFFAVRINNYSLYQQSLGFFLAFLALLSTTASTGYITFFIMLGILFITKIFSIYQFKVNKTASLNVILLLMFAGFIFMMILNLDLLSTVQSLTTSKNESDSFIHRVLSDLFAINIFFQTYGFGVGLGSNRPSSYLTSLLSNLGFIGTFIMFYILYIFTKFTIKYHNNEIKFLFFVFVSILISHILSIPDLTTSIFWISFGYIFAFLNYYSKKTSYMKGA